MRLRAYEVAGLSFLFVLVRRTSGLVTYYFYGVQMILAYCRVSTREQAEDGTTSIAEQTRRCKAVADLNSARAYDFVTYVDAGVSGSIPLNERPEGSKLLADAKKGDTIVASKMDRLFRSASDALNTAERLKKAGIDLVLIDMGVTPVTETGVAKMFFGMLALVAEFERERIAERMVDGKRGKRDRNGHCGGDAPFGYAVSGVGRESLLVPVEAEQKTLIRIKELRETHKLPYRIGKQLTYEGLLPRTGKPWLVPQIKRILERTGHG